MRKRDPVPRGRSCKSRDNDVPEPEQEGAVVRSRSRAMAEPRCLFSAERCGAPRAFLFLQKKRRDDSPGTSDKGK